MPQNKQPPKGDPDSLAQGLRKKDMYENSELLFKPDDKARASISRKLVVPTNRAFDVTVREYHTFSFNNPSNNNVTASPILTEESVTIEKYFLTNGVLITLQAVFKYDESTFFVAPESLVVKFSMYPSRKEEPKPVNRSKSIVNTERVLNDFKLV